jgi:stage II sporulation protein D
LLLAGAGESVRISASAFRFAISRALGWNTVRSDRYAITGNGLVLRGSGAGHGVGLCQRGADQMGAEGRSYREILSFYFPGTVEGLNARGIAWTRMAGEVAALMTTRPEQDRMILASAERQARSAGVSGIEVRIYPDLDTFRDATGEPGWVAAYTTGKRVHLQPSMDRTSLDATLRHETLHIMVEEKVRATLPLWFREGLVGWLSGEAHASPAERVSLPPSDADLRQRTDAAQARKSYAAAASMVSSLVARYGEATVMGWLTAGLPREVKNASASPAATKSK